MCTSFVLTSPKGASVYGRTMEFGVETNSEAALIPKKYIYKVKTGSVPPVAFAAKYDVIAMCAFKNLAWIGALPPVAHGMNEKGLAGGVLYFEGFADYAKPSEIREISKAAIEETTIMSQFDFLYWALSQFENVKQVADAINTGDIIVLGMTLEEVTSMKKSNPMAGEIMPFHYTLHDANGDSIVVEPIGGRLVVTLNPTSILTNSPEFQWHMTNLRNYVNLSPVNKGCGGKPEANDDEYKGFPWKTLQSLGQGSGWQ